METSIAKTSSSKSVILASTVKFDLLRKIFCQKYLDCCQVPRPSATVSGDFLSLYSYTAAHWRPARLPLLRRAGHHQPITFEDSFVSTNHGSCLSLAKKQLTRPRKKHSVLEASGYYELGKTFVREHVARKFFSSLKTAYYFSSIREDDFKLEPIVFGKRILATQDLKCCLSWFKILKTQLPFFDIANGQILTLTTRIWEKFS